MRLQSAPVEAPDLSLNVARKERFFGRTERASEREKIVRTNNIIKSDRLFMSWIITSFLFNYSICILAGDCCAPRAALASLTPRHRTHAHTAARRPKNATHFNHRTDNNCNLQFGFALCEEVAILCRLCFALRFGHFSFAASLVSIGLFKFSLIIIINNNRGTE